HITTHGKNPPVFRCVHLFRQRELVAPRLKRNVGLGGEMGGWFGLTVPTFLLGLGIVFGGGIAIAAGVLVLERQRRPDQGATAIRRRPRCPRGRPGATRARARTP